MQQVATRPRPSLRRTTRPLLRGLGVAVLTGAAAFLPTAGARAAAPHVVEYGPLPTGPISGACEVEFDRRGRLWVEQYLAGQFARMDPKTGRFTEFKTPMPLSVPGGEELGQDGAIWSTEVTGNALLRIDPDSGSMRELPLPWAGALSTTALGLPLHTGLGLANDISKGADGAMWFTLGGLNAVGRVDMATHRMTKYRLPTAVGAEQALFGIIKPGPGRTMVTDMPLENKVYSINVDTKAVKAYTMPTPLSFPLGVTTGPDGAIWVTEERAMKLARIDPATGKIAEYPLLGAHGLLSGLLNGISIGNPLPIPGPIVTGSDGRLYFPLNFAGSVGLGNRMASFDPATHKVATYATPSSLSSPCDINNEQAGSIWFAELTANKVGRLIIG
ncbi:Vgb family protein [Actinoallomurus sp. CA-150999]|uniref:Vgb family protein n=1 Tax=Actinoallomurus sp. CA-150999 TaxID=3239887 RepID=UPI003D917F02